jgi:hypothetical protein
VARATVAVLVVLGIGLVAGGIAAVRRFREADAPRQDPADRLPPVGRAVS